MSASSQSRIASLRNAFISGLILLSPLAVTWWVFALLFEKVGGAFRQHYYAFIPETLRQYEFIWNALATFAVVVIITILGYFSRYFLSRYFGAIGERFIMGIPGVSAVYNTVKQLVDTFGTSGKNSFSKVVLVEFPRKGCYTIGFLTGKSQGEPQLKAGVELWSVYVPTTPNPTGGYMLLLPPSEIVELEMSVGDGMKMVISGGAVMPGQSRNTNPPC